MSPTSQASNKYLAVTAVCEAAEQNLPEQTNLEGFVDKCSFKHTEQISSSDLTQIVGGHKQIKAGGKQNNIIII